MIHVGDITKLNGAELEPVWCITGGSPCQDLSVAGKRAGLAGARSGLFMEQVRIVKEMREHDRANGRTGESVRPRFLVWEKVPGAFSSNFKDGFGDFGAVLEEICRIAEPSFSLPRLEGKQKWTKSGAIDGDGWSVAWRTHDAQYWGVPQRRRRISLVADFGGQRAGEILFERSGLSGHPESGEPQREEAAGDPTECTGEHDCDGEPIAIDHVITTGGNCTAQGPCVYTDGNSPTLKAFGVHAVAAPMITDTIALEGNGQRESHKGDGWKQTEQSYTLNTTEVHGVAYGIDTYNQTIADVSHPLRSESGGDTTPKVAIGLDAYNQAVTGDQAKSLNSAASDSDHVPCVAYSLEPGIAAREGGHIYENVSGTLRSNAGDNQMSVACVVDSVGGQAESYSTKDLCGALKASHYKFPPCVTVNEVPYTLKVRGGVERDSAGKKAGKGALIQTDLSATLGVSQDQTLFQPVTVDCRNDAVNEELSGTIQSKNNGGFSLNYVNPVAYGIGSYASNAWKSPNPDSGVYQAEVAKTLDALQCGYPACNQGGTAVCEPLVYNGENVTNIHNVQNPKPGVCHTLDQDSRNYLVREEPMAWDGTQTSPTLTANNAGGNQRMPDKDNFNCVVEPTCLETFHCTTEEDGVTQPLKARDYKDPLCVTEPLLYDMTHANDVIRDCGTAAPTLQNRMGTGGNQVPVTVQRIVRWIVRRLTPRECERLQGFPDDWTNTGEWVDSKGKKHKDADSPRYKALGNSIALPFWHWMFQRMAKYLPADATLGSLFDGIGGFPLAWEAIHGKGTARWASEIEEFPIAVTKLRFPE